MQFYALEFSHSLHLVLSQIAISIGLHTAEHFKSQSGVDFHTLITFAFFRASVFSINWQLLEFIWILFKFVCNTCSTPRSTFWSLFQIVFYFIPVKFWFKIHWSCTQLLALFCRIFVPTLAFDFLSTFKIEFGAGALFDANLIRKTVYLTSEN